jgi:hypothetical protein
MSSPSSFRTACAACMWKAKKSSTTCPSTTKRILILRCLIGETSVDGIIKGMYRYSSTDSGEGQRHRPQLFGSGTILREAIRAQQILKDKYNIGCDVWSVTSYNELRRDAMDCQHWNDLHPGKRQNAATWSRFWTVLLVRSFPPVTTCDLWPTRFANGFRASTSCWELTDSAAAKRGRNYVATSRSTVNARHTRLCVVWRGWAHLMPRNFRKY